LIVVCGVVVTDATEVGSPSVSGILIRNPPSITVSVVESPKNVIGKSIVSRFTFDPQIVSWCSSTICVPEDINTCLGMDNGLVLYNVDK